VNVYLFAPGRQEKEWEPPVDVYRATWGWLLKFDLAGVRMEDVHVHISKRSVTVSGVRRDYMVEEGCSHYSM
jgi:HSP20 family protein